MSWMWYFQVIQTVFVFLVFGGKISWCPHFVSVDTEQTFAYSSCYVQSSTLDVMWDKHRKTAWWRGEADKLRTLRPKEQHSADFCRLPLCFIHPDVELKKLATRNAKGCRTPPALLKRKKTQKIKKGEPQQGRKLLINNHTPAKHHPIHNHTEHWKEASHTPPHVASEQSSRKAGFSFSLDGYPPRPLLPQWRQWKSCPARTFTSVHQ